MHAAGPSQGVNCTPSGDSAAASLVNAAASVGSIQRRRAIRRREFHMNAIFIHDLRVETKIGVYEWERHLPQTIRIDLEFGLPSARPFTSGDFADAVDYAAVVERIKVLAANNTHPLVERFAESAAQLVL